MDRPRTVGELRESGYRIAAVKDEMRRNLISRLKTGQEIFPGVLGYDDTVIPQIQNAILARHDVLLLGLRGQAKTRMLRMLVNLLDEVIPIIEGSEVNDDPFAPVSRTGKDMVAERGESCPIEWIGRERRYQEKLATPDVTIADLIGEIDMIKHAEGKYLSSELTMHFGLIPRSNRGIFCMNELPDLAPKIQVGLFNVLEERDVQIRGFPIRLNLDLCMVFSANPEDYTNRGRIVTPLKDRIGSVVKTHYPRTTEVAIQITEENAWISRDGETTVKVPRFVMEILEEMVRLARSSSHVNQSSGVSVRMSIANLENLISNTERRGLLHSEPTPIPRISDLDAIRSSSRGKLELTLSEDDGQEDKVVERLLQEAVKNVFDQHLTTKQLRDTVERIEEGALVEVGDLEESSSIVKQAEAFPDLTRLLPEVAQRLAPGFDLNDGLRASLVEFILEGLHVSNKLNKQRRDNKARYGR